MKHALVPLYVALHAALSLAPAQAQVNAYPNLGQTQGCTSSGRLAGQINMGGQSCASGWPAYQQRFASGFWGNRCHAGEQLTGLYNIRCTDVVRADGRPQANFVASGCCSLDAAAVSAAPALSAPPAVIDAPPAPPAAPPPAGHARYSPTGQFNPPQHSPLWRAGYTMNTACTGPVHPLPHFNSGGTWAPMVGFSRGPGQSNADLPVVFKNPMPTVAARNLVFAPHAVALHGSASHCAVLSFIAPYGGTYHIYGNFHQTGHNPGVAPHPRRAGVFVGDGTTHYFSGHLSTTQGVGAAPFDLTIPLGAGQAVHFMSNIDGVLNSNTVVLKVTVDRF